MKRDPAKTLNILRIVCLGCLVLVLPRMVLQDGIYLGVIAVSALSIAPLRRLLLAVVPSYTAMKAFLPLFDHPPAPWWTRALVLVVFGTCAAAAAEAYRRGRYRIPHEGLAGGGLVMLFSVSLVLHTPVVLGLTDVEDPAAVTAAVGVFLLGMVSFCGETDR